MLGHKTKHIGLMNSALKIIEDSKELLFMQAISISIYSIKIK